jgi:phenylacetic acid degradation operon negative regulatory protein
VRKRLYTALGWVGFGNPMPGLWTNPHSDRFAEAKVIIEDLGLRATARRRVAVQLPGSGR